MLLSCSEIILKIFVGLEQLMPSTTCIYLMFLSECWQVDVKCTEIAMKPINYLKLHLSYILSCITRIDLRSGINVAC